MRGTTKVVLLALVIALVVPQCAFAFEKDLVKGKVPSEYAIKKPVLEESVAGEYQPELADPLGASATHATNRISFAKFETGDICVAFSNPIGHAGLFDGGLYHGSASDYCMRSANVTPKNGVQLEQPAKYRLYDKAYGLWVPTAGSNGRYVARDFTKKQMGEPYDIGSRKSDYARWYCSKLAWAAYKSAVNIDLDVNGGFWVTPADLYLDGQTSLFAIGS